MKTEKIDYEVVDFYFFASQTNNTRLLNFLYHCPECGSVLGDEHTICFYCGSTLDGEIL